MKRAFVRNDGMLIDRVQRGSQTVVHHIPAWLMGEPVSEEGQQRLLRRLQTADEIDTTEVVEALGGELPAGLLEIVLERLERGDGFAALSLAEHYTDSADVRAALVAAARAAAVDDEGQVRTLTLLSQALGVVGGRDAADELERLVALLAADERTRAAGAQHNVYACALATAAEALLDLRRDRRPAAEALVTLLDHPCAFNRQQAAAMISRFLPFLVATKTSSAKTLRAGLAPLIDSEDDRQFLAAIPGLLACHQARDAELMRRCERLLLGDDPELRHSAALALTRVPPPNAVWALPMLIRALPAASSLEQQLELTRHVVELAPPIFVERLTRRALADESPMVRREGIYLLGFVPWGVAQALAAEALEDEPDPALEQQLRRFV